jgi:hypothetical protein
MLASRLGVRRGSKHAGEFLNPRFLMQRRHFDVRTSFANGFPHRQVVISAGCYLMQVSYTQYLLSQSDPSESGAYSRGGMTADARVHFIENYCRRALCVHLERLDGQHDPRQFAA